MCDPLAGCLSAPRKSVPKLFSLWRQRRDFPAAQWRSVLGQTLARCVTLRKQMERQVAELHLDAAEYLQSGLLHRADDKVALITRKHKMYLAYMLIQGYCEQAINHLLEIECCEKKECPLEAREAISSLLYVMPRCEELVELRLLKPLILSKFGKSFVSEVAERSIQCAVDKEIMLLLSFCVSHWSMRKIMLEKIAIDFDINWRSDSRRSYNSCRSASAPSSSQSSSIQASHQPASLAKDTQVKCKQNVLKPSSSGKLPGKNHTWASLSSQKCPVEYRPQPSQRKLHKVKLLHPSKLSSNQAARNEKKCAESTLGLQAAIQIASNATLAAPAFNLHVNSDDSDIDDGEGVSSKPSRLPEFEEVKARLMMLHKKKQHTQ